MFQQISTSELNSERDCRTKLRTSKLTVDAGGHAAAAGPAVVAVPAPAGPLAGTAVQVAVLIRRGRGDDAGGGDPAGRGADDARPVVVVLEGSLSLVAVVVFLAKTSASIVGLLGLDGGGQQDQRRRQGQNEWEPHHGPESAFLITGILWFWSRSGSV